VPPTGVTFTKGFWFRREIYSARLNAPQSRETLNISTRDSKNPLALAFHRVDRHVTTSPTRKNYRLRLIFDGITNLITPELMLILT